VINDPVNLIDPLGLDIVCVTYSGVSPNGVPHGPDTTCHFVGGTIEIDTSAGIPLVFHPGPGGAGVGGGPRPRYTVNLKVLNKCLSDLKIPVTISKFTPSTPGGFGSATGMGTDLFSFKGANSTITVKNDAATYNAVQVGALCGLSAALGCTDPSSPYTNFTNNNNSPYGTVATQVHELGHSLYDITTGEYFLPEPKDMGQALEDCVKKNHGIQKI